MGRKYTFKTKPRNYQVKALKRVVGMGSGALFMPMRSGKSKVAVDWASIMHMKHGVRRVLVVTHSPTTIGVWRNEFAKHCPLHYSLSDHKGAPLPTHGLEVWVMNVHRIYDREREGRSWKPVKRKALYDWEPELIIVDEATMIGDPTSVQSRHLYLLQKHTQPKGKLILTGTPMHRNLIMSFGMWKFVDDTLFGTALGAFKRQYALWGGFNNYTLLSYINLAQYRSKIEPYVYQLVRIPHRPPVNQVLPVDLTDSEREAYNSMASGGYLAVGPDKTAVSADNILTQLLKQAQLAGGHVRDDAGKWHTTGTSLKDSFAQLIRDLHDSEVRRVVVFAQFLPEVADAARAARAAGYEVRLLHGGVKQHEREERISAFHDGAENEDNFKVFVSQAATGSMGIDLSVADTVVWYSLPTSLLHKDQADARIRVHNDKRALTYYYLLPRKTVSEVTYMALQAKMDLADFIMKHPQLIHTQELG